MYTVEFFKMTGATLEELVDSATHRTIMAYDRYIVHGGYAKDNLYNAVDVSRAWDGEIRGLSTIHAKGTIESDRNGKGYQLYDVDITVPPGLFTTSTSTITTTTATTVTTNTVLAQLNKDLQDLQGKLADGPNSDELKALVGTVQQLEKLVETEQAARKAADANAAALTQQVSSLLPLADRVAALEADAKARATFPAGITKNELEQMQLGLPEQCSSNSCAPEVSATAGADLALTAKSGKVMLSSDQCGPTDLCTLVKAVQAMLAKYD